MSRLNVSLDYPDHPKTRRLIATLGLETADAFPVRMWSYLGRYHQRDGTFTGYSVAEVEGALKWGGVAGALVAALLRVGYLEESPEGLRAHDWEEHEGHLEMWKRRARNNAKKRWKNASASSNANSNAPSIPYHPYQTNQETKPMAATPAATPGSEKGLAPTPPESTPRPRRGGDLPPTPPGGAIPAPRNAGKAVFVGPGGVRRTAVQMVVLGFKFKMGVAEDDTDWDRVYFSRFCSPAKGLLTLFAENVERCLDCIDAVAEAHAKRGLSWMPETILNHAGEWKAHGKVFG